MPWMQDRKGGIELLPSKIKCKNCGHEDSIKSIEFRFDKGKIIWSDVTFFSKKTGEIKQIDDKKIEDAINNKDLTTNFKIEEIKCSKCKKTGKYEKVKDDE